MEEDVDFNNIVPFLFEPSYTEEELEVREQVVSSSRQSGGPETDCCLCGIWTFLQNEPVNVCCRDTQIAVEKMDLQMCITLTEDFKLALGTWHIQQGENRRMNNENFRFIAYRQYIGWIHGRLGRNRRKQVPSCVLKAIRKAFPSPDNRYVPFRQ